MNVLWFIGGAFLGAICGVMAACMCVVSKRHEKEKAEEENQKTEENIEVV